MKLINYVGKELFIEWLSTGQLRPACLEDVWGTHHARPCFSHPVTAAPYVSLPGTDASKWKRKLS